MLIICPPGWHSVSDAWQLLIALASPDWHAPARGAADNSINRYVNGELFNNATAPKVQIVSAASQVRHLHAAAPEAQHTLRVKCSRVPHH
jgi:hypothetical protein